MAVFDLPNGEKLNVPDQYLGDVDMASNIKDVYGIDINEVAYDLDWLADKPKSIARGAIGLAANLPLGLAGLFDIGDDSDTVKGLQAYKDYLSYYIFSGFYLSNGLRRFSIGEFNTFRYSILLG